MNLLRSLWPAGTCIRSLVSLHADLIDRYRGERIFQGNYQKDGDD
jgi:hypothetical protein